MVLVLEWCDIIFFIQSSKTSRKILKKVTFPLLLVSPWQRMTCKQMFEHAFGYNVLTPLQFFVCGIYIKYRTTHFRKFGAKKASYRLQPFAM